MALADPQSLTYATVARTLYGYLRGESSSVYRTEDGVVKLTISHAFNRRDRSLVKFEFTTFADPLVAGSTNVSTSVAFTVDRPKTGHTNIQVLDMIKVTTTWLTAATDANAKAFLQFQV